MAHRLPKNRTDSHPAHLVVRFTNLRIRNAVYAERKSLTSHKPAIYINEHWTKDRVALFYQARYLMKNKIIQGVPTISASSSSYQICLTRVQCVLAVSPICLEANASWKALWCKRRGFIILCFIFWYVGSCSLCKNLTCYSINLWPVVSLFILCLFLHCFFSYRS